MEIRFVLFSDVADVRDRTKRRDARKKKCTRIYRRIDLSGALVVLRAIQCVRAMRLVISARRLMHRFAAGADFRVIL